MTNVERYLAENSYTGCPGMLEILEAYEAWTRTHPDNSLATGCTGCDKWREGHADIEFCVECSRFHCDRYTGLAPSLPTQTADAGPLREFLNWWDDPNRPLIRAEDLSDALIEAVSAIRRSLGMEKP